MIKEKWMDEILTKQFEMVGLEYNPHIVKKEGWYLEHSWTAEQQEDFKAWLSRYLKRRLKFTKEYCDRQAAWHILHVGWRLSDGV